MKNYFLALFWLFLAHFTNAKAQNPILDSNICRALNSYVLFANEVVHSSSLMYNDYETINLQFNDFLEKKINLPKYERVEVLDNYDFFLTLPKDLHKNISKENQFLPAEKRKQLYELISQTHTTMQKMEGIRLSLQQYINNGTYKKDNLLQTGFDYLQDAELAYIDLFILQQRLHQSLNSLVSVYQKKPKNEANLLLISQLYPIVGQCQQLFFAVKNDNPAKDIRKQNIDFSSLLLNLTQRRTALLAHIAPNLNSDFCLHKRFDTIIDRAQKISQVVLDYQQNANKKYQNLLHKSYFYFYNIDLISLHNRPNDGLSMAFNKLVTYTNENWILACELPLHFEVLYPNISAFDKYKQQFEMPDPEQLAKIWKAKQDSLVEDSIKLANQNPKIGDKSLKGFATNNLIFVLDVSLDRKSVV